MEGVGDRRSPYELRRHQRQALSAIEAAESRGARRAWVVLPPGAGKTLVGLETIRRRGRTAVVLGPNTAISTQWAAAWDEYGGEPAGTSRDLEGAFTALTYQALASFDDAAEDATPGRTLADLHPNGQQLVRRLRAIGDLTIVLDECHHLLEVWGRLVGELLDLLPDAFVLGLTATPPSSVTVEQQQLVDELFGDPVAVVSIPAMVREGDLAPFAELVWLTGPTPSEREWLAAQGERFTELTTALSDPAYGSIGFFAWLDARLVDQDVSWQTRAAGEPELTDAALRMVHAGLLRLPPGARLTERHRHAPTAADWVVLLDGWVRQLAATGRDDALVERVRLVLPSVGYQLTKRGIRRGRTPVDRVLARSEAKPQALAEIAAAEQRNLGDRLRLLVLCDHERASATVPADLEGVLDEQAGSALLALSGLQRAVPELSPMLVTGSTVAGSEATLQRFLAYVGRADLAITEGRVVGPWSSRDWLPWVTRFFQEGHVKVLVGTRGLLGEGWDAPSVTGLVDLTTATTPTAVVQTRGRALRVDPSWPDKVALTWTVVCVSEDHPEGGNDWDRFVRKHEGFWGVDADGEVVSGVAHVDATLSPYAPPPVAAFDELNARMLVRSEQRAAIRAGWAVGTPYEDDVQQTVRIIPSPAHRSRREPAPVVLHRSRVAVRDDRPSPWRPHFVLAVALVFAVDAYLMNLAPSFVITLGLLVILAIQTTVAVSRGRRTAEELARTPSLEQVAFAVADALYETDQSPVGHEGVRVGVDEQGVYRCVLEGVDAATSRAFAGALDEVVSPMVSPRYVVPRWVVDAPVGNGDGLRAALHRLRPDGVVWHTVPSVLGTTGHRAQAFARTWDRWVGGGPALYTGSPEGEGVLVTHRGSDPLSATTVLRLRWH